MIPVLGMSALVIIWIGIFLICRQIEQTPTWKRISERIDTAFGSMLLWGWKVVCWLVPGLIVGIIVAMLVPWGLTKILIGAWVLWSFLNASMTSQRTED